MTCCLLPSVPESNSQRHPDDPPLPTLRGTPRLIHHPEHYQRLLDYADSTSNGLEFCVGTLTEMPGTSDLVAVIDRYAAQQRIVYVHLRNVVGKAPHYRETFIDDGDANMRDVLRALHRHGFEGVLIPDHTPQMSCAAPWHAGMAYALGYMKALVEQVTGEAHDESYIRGRRGHSVLAGIHGTAPDACPTGNLGEDARITLSMASEA